MTTSVSNRSAQLGLVASTSASFFERLQPLDFLFPGDRVFDILIFLGVNEGMHPIAPRKRTAFAASMLGHPILEIVGDADIHDVPVHACQDVDVVRPHLAPSLGPSLRSG